MCEMASDDRCTNYYHACCDTDCADKRHDEEQIARLTRERDEAREQRDNVIAERERAWQQRDEARAEVARLREEVESCRRAVSGSLITRRMEREQRGEAADVS